MTDVGKTDASKVAYEQAVKAYQFHVQRYHTWVNYYAIFTGVLFVAFYTVMPKGGRFCLSYVVDWPLDSGLCFSYLVLLVGWWASVCWLASIVGHYRWLLSWTRVVKQREREYFVNEGENGGKPLWVYGKVLLSRRNQPKPNPMEPGFVSTQKVTQLFVKGVIGAWVLASFLLGASHGLGCWAFVVMLVLALLTCRATTCIFHRTSLRYSSEHLDIEEVE